MKKTYQVPTLNQDIVYGECQLLVGTTIPVIPSEEGSQSQAESKSTGDYFEEVDKSIRSYEHNPLDYLPKVFNNPWQEE
jgi:hypothetical protein